MSGGRPSKYDDIDLEQVEKLAGLGLIDREIAHILDISEVTLNKYKKTPEFLKSLKKGKLIADRKVTESLYHRALGYTHPEEKIFCHEGMITRADTIKQYPPDSTAMIFWLKNRRPDLWRDKAEVDINGKLVTMPAIMINGKELKIDIGDKDSGDLGDPGEAAADTDGD